MYGIFSAVNPPGTRRQQHRQHQEDLLRSRHPPDNGNKQEYNREIARSREENAREKDHSRRTHATLSDEIGPSVLSSPSSANKVD
jgi:hypothetical protein